MNMKEHILAGLRELFERWEDLLSAMSDAQITQPQFDLDWSVTDVMAHLWAWQPISIARLVGGVHDTEPEYPR